MNQARLVKILRERARLARETATLDEEFADALEEDGVAPANDTTPKPKRRRSPPLVKPTGRVRPSDVDMKRADAILARHFRR